jgi:hypothetical protein
MTVLVTTDVTASRLVVTGKYKRIQVCNLYNHRNHPSYGVFVLIRLAIRGNGIPGGRYRHGWLRGYGGYSIDKATRPLPTGWLHCAGYSRLQPHIVTRVRVVSLPAPRPSAASSWRTSAWSAFRRRCRHAPPQPPRGPVQAHPGSRKSRRRGGGSRAPEYAHSTALSQGFCPESVHSEDFDSWAADRSRHT